MSDHISISLNTRLTGSVECGGSNTDQYALSSKIQSKSLSLFTKEFMRGKDELPWTSLMEWFIEAAIGVALFRKHNRSAPPLIFENIRIDGSSTILIDPSSTRQEQHSNVGSLASDFSTISSFFLDIHRTLDQTKRLILPLDHSIDAVCSRILVALLEHFIASGDLILPHSSPHDHFQYFLDFYDGCFTTNPSIIFSLTEPLAQLFCLSVLSPSNRDHFVPTPNSFLRGSDVAKSEQLLKAVDKVKETRSLDVVRNLHFDWEEWVTMMEMVEKGVTALTDLSFLQSHCFRRILEALQAKHQNRANPPQSKESCQVESSSEVLQTTLPFRSDSSLHFISSLSTETQLPSQHSSSFSGTKHSSYSSDTQIHSSPQSPHLNQLPSRDASILHSLEILIVIHSLLSKPQLDSFPWKLREEFTPETELEILFFPTNVPISLDERFGPSMFDETDIKTMVLSLTRCLKVIVTTQSLQCIDDLHSFLSLLIAGLHHTHKTIAAMCFHLFQQIINFLPVLDPRADQFRTLRNAFRDGTQFEQRALLNLWRTWFDPQTKGTTGQSMRVVDFDFDGFLVADLTKTPLFNDACLHVLRICSSRDASMARQWKSDFIFKFEKNHRVLYRLAGQPGPWSNQFESGHHLSRQHIFFAEEMSVHHGFDFPSALTERITIDLSISPHMLSKYINPATFLNHTSIAPKHRHSFFPMDLIFERYFRDNPTAFFGRSPDLTICSMRKFLNTPLVGLHSLLIRSIPLHFNEQTLAGFFNIFGDVMRQEINFNEYHSLYTSFPPPRLLDILVSSPHLIRANKSIWEGFMLPVWGLCGSVAPFGACSSLAKVFKMLAPFDTNPNELELMLLAMIGNVVVSLHWLSIPADFDSPLICHLPSLAGAQRGVLQKLFSRSGTPSLVAPYLARLVFKSPPRGVNDIAKFYEHLITLSFSVRSSQFKIPLHAHLSRFLFSPFPTVVSAAFEFFHRFVSFSSDTVRMKLLKFNLFDDVVFAVSCSSFLDDYEKGIAVIGILLDTIRRDNLKRRMRAFDFYRGQNAQSRS
ncbi:hypothetical protein BLNAU_11252 [Blattamonas nauphoetae]|uniref:Uncharacterized protein n=1 Tax=Blattamonas nauphoetae TaxID=2049346 RepID=A0ABQ9XQM2_9EUKA|nr:hypothetical protein BLNAU_11252 [Blattamonas nauphoetae]